MISNKIIQLASDMAGDEIPKPEAKAPFLIKSMGVRRGESALIYTIPSHTGARRYEKGVTLSEFEKAYAQLQSAGHLDRSWFNSELSACAKEGSCNFTTIGGVFEILGLAKYAERGRYISAK